MPWDFTSDRPIFLQIIEKIQLEIVSDRYRPGDKLPSVRELAQEASVNPNTMQKALSELERTGLVYSHRTSGRFITEDAAMVSGLRAELAEKVVAQFLLDLQKLGFQKESALTLITNFIKGDEK